MKYKNRQSNVNLTMASLMLALLTANILAGVPFLPEFIQDYDEDVAFCSLKHPDLNLLPRSLTASNDTSTEVAQVELTITQPGTAESKNLKFIIKQDLDTYFKTNLGDTAIWVIFFFLCFFSFIGCIAFQCYRSWKKERILLNTKQLEEAIEKQRADAE